MPQIINSNIASLTAQRNLNTSQSQLNTALERLSSGLRINSAKDDAAGLAISERMTSQIRGLNQAIRNANDGISLAQTAEGALGEIGNNLQRIRELAIQSANATNSASDRASLQAEAAQLVSEVTRVANQTQFNGLDLLDGSFTSQSFQVGANANQTIDISQIADARASALGNNTLVMSGSVLDTVVAAAAGTAPASTVTADATVLLSTNLGSTATGDISIAAADSAATIASKINTAAAGIGITADADTTATISGISAAGSVSFTLNGTTAITASVADVNDLSDLASAINGRQSSSGVTASFANPSDKSTLTLTDKEGNDILIEGFTHTTAAATATVTGNGGTTNLVDAGANSTRIIGSVTLATAEGQISVANQAAAGALFDVATSTFNAVSTLDVSTAAGSQKAIDIVDAALSQVNGSRGDLGAVQNRFTSTIANLQTTSENLSASRSRIQDADFAEETAAMTRGQILQQAGVAILAQANSLPNNVLSLLR
ncbi:MAG: flagellin [Nitrosomonas sp.]|nr:flagellin [Nitrosomonas sp.]